MFDGSDATKQNRRTSLILVESTSMSADATLVESRVSPCTDRGPDPSEGVVSEGPEDTHTKRSHCRESLRSVPPGSEGSTYRDTTGESGHSLRGRPKDSVRNRFHQCSR